jgi:hypothetical protein
MRSLLDGTMAIVCVCFVSSPSEQELIQQSRYCYKSDVVCWVTQLVVDAAMRQRYIATSILTHIKFHAWFASVDVVGVVSSHPVTCRTVATLARKLD